VVKNQIKQQTFVGKMKISNLVSTIRPVKVLIFFVISCLQCIWVTNPLYPMQNVEINGESVYEVSLKDFSSLQAGALFMLAISEHPDLCADLSAQAGFLSIQACEANLSYSQVGILVSGIHKQAVKTSHDVSKEDFGDILLNLEQVFGAGVLSFMMGVEYDRNSNCAISDPFCTSEVYTFPAGVNSGTAEPGPFYDCLYTQPNPVWYHMRILLPGAIQITMSSNPSEDIDFILWGPFDDPFEPCPTGLTENKVVDCSYSTASTEICDIPNGQVGEYYILMITNYSNDPCEITFSKTGGTGETDCSIVPPPIGSNSPVCVGEQIQLYADPVANANYFWTGPNGFTSNQQNPVINNAQLSHAGTYTLVITVGGNQSDPISTEVEVFPMPVPNFSYTTACLGEPTQFTDQTTVNPPSAAVTAWEWNFGDGNTSTLQNPLHQFATAGTFQVTLTAYTDNMQCAQSITLPVTVGTAGIADAGPDQTIPHGWYTTLSGNGSGGSGSFSYAWQPAAYLVNPNMQHPQTLPLTSTTVFTLTLTDNESNCSSTDQVTINVSGNQFVVNASANPGTICPGESAQLSANASGGSANYSYSWTSNPTGFSSIIANPVVSPDQTTTYIVEVFDGQLSITDQVTVTVGEVTHANAGPDQSIPTGWTTELEGSVSGGSGSFVVNWQPAALIENNTILNAVTLPLTSTTTFTLTITDNSAGCVSTDQMVVTITGGVLSVEASADPSEICEGESVQLQAVASGGSGSYTYIWSSDPPGFNSTLAAPLATPIVPTIYFVEVNDGQNTVEGQVSVDVGQVTIANAGPDITIPAGTSTQLQGSVSGGSGSYSIVWEPQPLLVDPDILQPETVLLDETSLFTLHITDNSSGCTTINDMTVIVSGAVLAVTAQANPTFICPGEQVQLTANTTGGTGSYTYTWSSIPPGFTSDQPVAYDNPIETTTYHVEVSDGQSTVSDQVTVEVGELSVADAGPDFEVTYEWPAELVGSVGGDVINFTVNWSPEELFEDDNHTQLVTSSLPLTAPVNFTLTLTNTLSGCLSVDDVFVDVNGGPLGVNATASPQAICTGESTQLNAVAYGGEPANYSYTWWSVPAGFTSNIQNPVVQPNSSTTYFVQVNDGYNTAEAEVFVQLIPRPTAHAGTNEVINVGTFTHLNGTATGGSGVYSWLWAPADSLNNPQTDPFISNPQTKLLFNTTTFTLVVTDANGCVSHPSSLNVVVGGDQLGVFAQADPAVICLGEITGLQATVYGGSQQYSYSWTADNSSWTANTAVVEVSPQTTTRYTVEIDDGFLQVSDYVDVTVNQLPVFDIVPSNLNLVNDTLVVCVRDSVMLNAGPGYGYYWSNGSVQQVQKATTNGNWLDWQTWWVEVSDIETGCSKHQQIVIFFNFNACNIGLDEHNQNHSWVKVFPNPSTGKFEVSFEKVFRSIELGVYNLQGQLLMIHEISKESTFEIDLSTYPSGPYMLKLISEKEVVLKKVIKN
jgi:PKD repeat protein